jgi:hypothetical protein
MSARARDWAWQRVAERGEALPLTARMVLLYLAERADDDGYCWPKIATIAGETGGLDRTTVFRQITLLCEAGLVERERRRREDGGDAANGYQLLIVAAQTPGRTLPPPRVADSHPPGSHDATPRVAQEPPPRVALAPPQEPSGKNRQVEPAPSGPGADGRDPAQPDLFGAVPPPPVETVGQKANRLTTVYTDLVPLSRFPAVAGIVRKALQAGKTETEITDALARLGKEGRPVTVDTLRIEIDGLPPRRDEEPPPTRNRIPEAWRRR